MTNLVKSLSSWSKMTNLVKFWQVGQKNKLDQVIQKLVKLVKNDQLGQKFVKLAKNDQLGQVGQVGQT